VTRAQVDVGGLTFDIHLWGPADGKPLLMLHGFPQNSGMWERVAASLPTARCVAPDQRGYSPGARPDSVDAYRIELLVGDALGILDAFGVERAHVVGHDFGATVAWHLAARVPERVARLTTVSVPHPGAIARALATDPRQREAFGYIRFFRAEPDKAEQVLLRDNAARLRALFDGSGMSADQVDRFVAPLQEPGALRAALSWYRAIARPDSALGPVEVPTTYIWGDGDIALMSAAAHACGDFVTADYRFIPLVGVSHWVAEQRPDVIIDTLAM
jgi:pimeloyl-ACP methyl ester carboxylesterase